MAQTKTRKTQTTQTRLAVHPVRIVTSDELQKPACKKLKHLQGQVATADLNKRRGACAERLHHLEHATTGGSSEQLQSTRSKDADRRLRRGSCRHHVTRPPLTSRPCRPQLVLTSQTFSTVKENQRDDASISIPHHTTRAAHQLLRESVTSHSPTSRHTQLQHEINGRFKICETDNHTRNMHATSLTTTMLSG